MIYVWELVVGKKFEEAKLGIVLCSVVRNCSNGSNLGERLRSCFWVNG